MNTQELIYQLMAYSDDADTVRETMEQWLNERGFDVIARDDDADDESTPFRTLPYPDDTVSPCACEFIRQPHGHDPVTNETIFFVNGTGE